VSKTFKILDNELGLINEHIKQRGSVQNNEPPHLNESNTFRTSVTPTVLNSLLRTSQEPVPSDGLFNNIFNRFLTGDMNFTQSPLHSQESEQDTSTQEQTPPQPQPQSQSQSQSQPQSQPQPNYQSEETNEQDTQENPQLQSSLSFSVNYLPLNSSYRQYLIRREGLETPESIE
jgi:hypothetical protein